MEKQLNEPILIIKTSWGGRSLLSDFRPPSAGQSGCSTTTIVKGWKGMGVDPVREAERHNKELNGVFYRHMIEHVRKVLADIKRVVPEYDPKQGYELAGFVWFQGFNDLVDGWTYHNQNQPGGYDQYSQLLADFIRDVRKDLSAPKLPFVIGVMGIGGVKDDESRPWQTSAKPMAAPASLPEFKGNVVAVQTAPFWDDDLAALQVRWRTWPKMDEEAKKNPNDRRRRRARKGHGGEPHAGGVKRLKAVSNGGYHYLGAAKIMAPIGKAFAEAMVKLQKAQRQEKQ